MEDEMMGDIDDLFDDLDQPEDFTNIPFIGSENQRDKLEKKLANFPAYQLQYYPDLEKATDQLLQETYPIIIIEQSDVCIEISITLQKLSNLSRILLITTKKDVEEFVEIYNQGKIDTFLLPEYSGQELFNKLTLLEAQYDIEIAVTNFVQEPPKLSKASFMLLDPQIAEGDEDTPLNFVGVMIVHNSVPKYSVFFEDALEQDEFLFAGYLSSISSLGDELFQSKETLKEINFGGISVIFRFKEKIQIAFLVKNLNNYNVEKAEKRIDNVTKDIFSQHAEELKQPVITDEKEQELDHLFNKFEAQDEVEEQKYEELVEDNIRKSQGKPVIVILSQRSLRSQHIEYINQFGREENIDVQTALDQNHTTKIIENRNTVMTIIDAQGIEANKTDVFIAESIEEHDPSVQIWYYFFSTHINDTLEEIIDAGNIDFLLHETRDPIWYRRFIEESIEESHSVKAQMLSSDDKDEGGSQLSVAKARLKEDLESFDEVEKPKLEGLLISRDMKPIYQKFWEVNGEKRDFDMEMFTGLVTSLKQISQEMFADGSNIDAFEVSGSDVFVRFADDLMFIYFIHNLTSEVSGLVSKELDAVTDLFMDLINEAKGIEMHQLTPLFDKTSNRVKSSFTELLTESEK